MIDMESVLFTKIATSLRSSVDGIYVVGEYVSAPPKFPAVSIIEMDNYVDRNTSTNAHMENTVYVMYEVNVYSNRTKGKKAECKSIAALIDAEFMKYGFERVVLNQVQNANDATIYRMVGRYRAVVGKDSSDNFTVFRR